MYELVAEKVVEWGEACMGDTYSNVGCVVGATYPEMGKVLRKLMPKTYILVPGYGAQGGKAADLVHYFNPDGLGAIVNSSRGIIAAYKQDKYASFGETGYAEREPAGSQGHDRRHQRRQRRTQINRRFISRMRPTKYHRAKAMW